MFETSADVYDRFVGRYSPALAQALIGAAGVRAGDRALDVGCGPGALTGELVALLGADHVVAADPSQPFVEACRARYPGVQVELAAAESLPFDDDGFDVALAQLVVNFMEDPRAGVGEMSRVTRPGGAVAGAVWDYGGKMTLLRSFWDAAAAVDPSTGQRDERHVRMATTAELNDLWSEVGLAEVNATDVVVSAGYDSFEDLWQPLELGVGPAGAYAASLTPQLRDALKQNLRTRLGVGESPFRLTARAWIVTGRVG